MLLAFDLVDLAESELELRELLPPFLLAPLSESLSEFEE